MFFVFEVELLGLVDLRATPFAGIAGVSVSEGESTFGGDEGEEDCGAVE